MTPATEDKKEKDGNESDDDPNLIKPILNGARLEKQKVKRLRDR